MFFYVLFSYRFLIQPKPAPPRRDVHLQHVIISEKADEKISAHRVGFPTSESRLPKLFVDFQVNDLPFPFVNVDQFETLIQQPLGREWNPETAYRRLNQPKVRTRIGVRIEPLNKQDVFLKHNRSKADLDFDLSANDPEQDSLFDNDQTQKKRKRKAM